MIGDHRRRKEPGQLQSAVTVRGTQHGNFDAHSVQPGDAIRPISFDRGAPLELEASSQHPPKTENIARTTFDFRDGMQRKIGPKNLNAFRFKDRCLANEIPASKRAFQDDVQSIVALACHRVLMRRNLCAIGESEEIEIEGNQERGSPGEATCRSRKPGCQRIQLRK